jgi:hypothetical protein
MAWSKNRRAVDYFLLYHQIRPGLHVHDLLRDDEDDRALRGSYPGSPAPLAEFVCAELSVAYSQSTKEKEIQ